MTNKRIVMLAQHGDHANITYHSIAGEFPIDSVIFERPEPRGKFIRRRIRRLGLLKVIGQTAFQLAIVPVLRARARNRIQDICCQYDLANDPIPMDRIVEVRSINSKSSRLLLERLNPDVIIVVGTRIISKRLLNTLSAVFINIHCGITPLYRGAHGAYWARVRGDAGACGVTIHHVDPGIDTGGILHQGLIEPTPQDNYYTYPYLQFAVGIPLMKQAIDEALHDRLRTQPAPAGESCLWSHPTLLEYLTNRITRGVS